MAYTTHVMSTTHSGEEMTARAIDFVERYCSICIVPNVVIDEVDGGHQSLRLLKGPVIEIIAVHDMYQDLDVPETDNWRLGVEGKVVAQGERYWARGSDRFRVTYEAGYEDLPPALEILVEEIETYAESWSGGEGLRAEKFGRDYSWEAALALDASVAPLIQRLNLWRRL